MRIHQLARAAVLVLGVTILILVAWGTFRTNSAPSRPFAPISLGVGAIMAMLIPDRSLWVSALRLAAVSLGLISAILWVSS